MPGIGVRTCARILTEVTGKHFASAAHLASYAGIAPVTRRSGTWIRGEHGSGAREQETRTRPVPLRVRGAVPPALAGLLRPQTRRRKTPQLGHIIALDARISF